MVTAKLSRWIRGPRLLGSWDPGTKGLQSKGLDDLDMLRRRHGIDAALGIGCAVHSGRTDGERPRRRLVSKRSIGHATFKGQLLGQRPLKADKVLPQRRGEMETALEPDVDHSQAALAWRTTGGQRGGQAAILLGQGKRIR
jgi:hypothetical protein